MDPQNLHILGVITNSDFGGLTPSLFMVLGSKGSMIRLP